MSKIVLTIEGDSCFESEAFMQMIIDNAHSMVDGYNYIHAGKLSMHRHCMWESGREVKG